MAKTVADVMNMVKENEVKFVDFRFTDTRGKEQHVTVPVSHFDEDKFTSGHAFDGSSIAGWKGIEASDMQLMPDPKTANIDPFFGTMLELSLTWQPIRQFALSLKPSLLFPGGAVGEMGRFAPGVQKEVDDTAWAFQTELAFRF